MSARRRHQPRRSCHAVPGSSERFLAKAPSLDADMYFLDLEDSVAPLEKEAARTKVVAAARDQDWGEAILCVRLNGWATKWTYRDVIDVVSRAGERLDVVMLPKVERAAEVVALDLLLSQVEADAGLPLGHVGIEAQIESARGLIQVEEIRGRLAETETLILGPVDFSASIGMPSLGGGLLLPDYPGDYFHYVYMKILMAGRANDLQVIDGPYVKVRDPAGLREYSRRAQVLGFDGKWSLHPDQIGILNEVFSPTQEQFDQARTVVEAYRAATQTGARRGAVMLGDEMVDEASNQAALTVVLRGERAGLSHSD